MYIMENADYFNIDDMVDILVAGLTEKEIAEFEYDLNEALRIKQQDRTAGNA